MEVDRFLDVLHQIIERIALCMAALQLGYEGEVSVLIVLDDDL